VYFFPKDGIISVVKSRNPLFSEESIKNEKDIVDKTAKKNYHKENQK